MVHPYQFMWQKTMSLSQTLLCPKVVQGDIIPPFIMIELPCRGSKEHIPILKTV